MNPTADLRTQTARIVSWLLHPFLQPLYLMGLLLTRTAFAYYPPAVKHYLWWVVMLYTMVIPMLLLLVLHHTGRIGDLRLHERRDRLLPLLLGACCYALCAYTIGRIPSALFIRKFMAAACCCEVLCLVVTRWWKISLHLTGMGTLTALLTVIGFIGAGQMIVPIVVTVLATGLLASARLYLGCHNGAQILAGFCGGFITTVLAILLL